MVQISNKVYCLDFLFDINIETKFLPSSYYEYPFLIIDDFLSIEEIRIINTQLQESEYSKAKLKLSKNLSKNHIDENIRKTRIHKLDSFCEKIYYNSFKKYQSNIESFFNLAIISSTKIQALEYKQDSFYSIHSDDSSMLYSGDELVGFLPVAKDRKISTVLFTTSYNEKLNSDAFFTGGELCFNYLYDELGKQISFKPKAGQMIVFPSNPFFCHEVKIVKKGRRLSLVQWHNVILN